MKSKIDGADLVILMGIVVLSAGLWLIWPPLALTVLGIILTVVGLAMAIRKKRG